MNPKPDLNLALLAHVQKTGQAIEILDEIINDDVFSNLSKHNPFWNQSEELDDLRMKICSIYEKVIEIRDFMKIDPYENTI